MQTATEIRSTENEITQQFWSHKTDEEITNIATTKEIFDAFSMISNIQEGLAGGFIGTETAIEQMNHVKLHLLDGMEGIEPEHSYRRDTMFIGFMCSCTDTNRTYTLPEHQIKINK